MRIYISVPIKGRKTGTLEEKKTKAKEYSERVKESLLNDGHDAITPFDCNEWNFDENTCLGNDITALLNSDAIYLCAGWRNSQGCQLEYMAAEIYNKEIIKDEL